MTRLGEFELQDQIGAGSSGTVWRALRHGPVPQIVAVKRLRATGNGPEDLARLRREALVLTELDHPHIVRVLAVLPDGHGLAICMQYAPGGSLEALLAQRGRLSPGEVVAVAAPIAGALASAHRRGILHVDVKPANILFTSDGEPLLGDFGVARTLGRLTAVLGSEGAIAGTAHYLAPELLDGATPDARSDVYSLGVVCYEALSGTRPFDAPLPLAVLRAADAGRYEPLTGRAGVPAPLARIVEQAMARDPERRPATAAGLAQALRESLPHAAVRLPDLAAGSRPAVAIGPVPPGHGPEARAPGDRREPPGEARDTVPISSTPAMSPPAGPALDVTAPAGPAPGETASDVTTPHVTTPHVTAPDVTARAGGAPLTAPGGTVPVERVPVTGASGGAPAAAPAAMHGRPDAAADADGTRTFGPRPPRPDPEPEPRRRHVRRWAALVAAVLAGALAYVVLRPSGSGDDCPDLDPPLVDDGAQVVRGDPEGDGCATFGVYDLARRPEGEEDMVLTIPIEGVERRIRMGELGDRLFLGDWECDGIDTPGIYRWRQGEVEYFDTWPEVENRPYRPADIEKVPRRGRASLVVAEPAGSDSIGNDDDSSGSDGSDSGSGSGSGNDDGSDSGGGAGDERCDRIEVRAREG